ncbi:MAG: L,D-transpeptidase family protein [Verrucomicrobiae bacterium]|nr:L,D-transpeptidase family protein [Verrucomicrobiae bacterium]
MSRILRNLTYLTLCFFMIGCASTSGKSGRKKQSSRDEIVLIRPDGTRFSIPDQENPPSADLIALPYEWHPEISLTGTVMLEIVLNEQRVYIYRGGKQIGYTQISTGREGYNTPVGNYTILQKKREYYSNQYGSFVDNVTGKVVDNNAEIGQRAPAGAHYEPAPMPYFQRLTWGGVGLHEGFLPGYPASHGCIRVHRDMAHHLFEVTQVGTPVVVTPSRQNFLANTTH